MRNVDASARVQPAKDTASTATRHGSPSTLHTVPGSDRHCQISNASTALEART